MKYIFEMIKGVPFLYREDEEHYNTVKNQRTSKQLNIAIIDNCPNMKDHGKDYFIVFEGQDRDVR